MKQKTDNKTALDAETLMSLVREVLRERLSEANPYHSPKTGRLSAGNAGDVYSITKPAADRYGNELGRGVVTKKGQLRAKFGMNSGKDQCGRRSMKGGDHSPRYSCSKYKDRYEESLDQDADLAEEISQLKVMFPGGSIPTDIVLSALFCEDLGDPPMDTVRDRLAARLQSFQRRFIIAVRSQI